MKNRIALFLNINFSLARLIPRCITMFNTFPSSGIELKFIIVIIQEEGEWGNISKKSSSEEERMKLHCLPSSHINSSQLKLILMWKVHKTFGREIFIRKKNNIQHKSNKGFMISSPFFSDNFFFLSSRFFCLPLRYERKERIISYNDLQQMYITFDKRFSESFVTFTKEKVCFFRFAVLHSQING